MIEFTKSKSHDIGFISNVQILANRIIKNLNPEEIFLFKVDNWFDSKWLNFTGKVLGLVGTWNHGDATRIPPFSPNRIIEDEFYKRNESGRYDNIDSPIRIHKRQPAEENLQNRIIDISPSAVFIWYSSNTVANEHGSLMIYPVENQKCEPFYVGFKKNKKWDIVNAPGSNRKGLESYLHQTE